MEYPVVQRPYRMYCASPTQTAYSLWHRNGFYINVNVEEKKKGDFYHILLPCWVYRGRKKEYFFPPFVRFRIIWLLSISFFWNRSLENPSAMGMVCKSVSETWLSERGRAFFSTQPFYNSLIFVNTQFKCTRENWIWTSSYFLKWKANGQENTAILLLPLPSGPCFIIKKGRRERLRCISLG